MKTDWFEIRMNVAGDINMNLVVGHELSQHFFAHFNEGSRRWILTHKQTGCSVWAFRYLKDARKAARLFENATNRRGGKLNWDKMHADSTAKLTRKVGRNFISRTFGDLKGEGY